jgi:hypothetical protein
MVEQELGDYHDGGKDITNSQDAHKRIMEDDHTTPPFSWASQNVTWQQPWYGDSPSNHAQRIEVSRGGPNTPQARDVQQVESSPW